MTRHASRFCFIISSGIVAVLCAGMLASPALAAGFRIIETTDSEVTQALRGAVADVSSLAEGPDAAIEQSRLLSLTRGFGYLAAKVAISPPQASGGVMISDVRVDLGRQFKLGSIDIVGLDTSGSDALALDLQARLQQEVGQLARANILATLSSELRWRVEQASYPLVHIVRTSMNIDEATQTASASIEMSPGPRADFGALTFKGARSTPPRDLQALVPFRVGEAFDPVLLDQLRASLLDLPRVRSASVSVGSELAADGTVPIDVSLDEYQDPGLLADNKTAGVIGLLGALVLVVALELHARFGRSTWIRFAIRGALVIALSTGFLISTYRAWMFIQLG